MLYRWNPKRILRRPRRAYGFGRFNFLISPCKLRAEIYTCVNPSARKLRSVKTHLSRPLTVIFLWWAINRENTITHLRTHIFVIERMRVTFAFEQHFLQNHSTDRKKHFYIPHPIPLILRRAIYTETSIRLIEHNFLFGYRQTNFLVDRTNCWLMQ